MTRQVADGPPAPHRDAPFPDVPYPEEFYQPWTGPCFAWLPIYTPDRGKIWLRRYWRAPSGTAYARNGLCTARRSKPCMSRSARLTTRPDGTGTVVRSTGTDRR
jgi:hypothetical protein